jgi:DNA helicase II / ATP-dependent DNA helicase PcrA
MSSLPPHVQHRIDEQLALSLQARLLTQQTEPYFAHLRVRIGVRERDLLLGTETRTGKDVSIIDWQNAPLAEVFFSCAPGDDYELDTGDRVLTGTLLARTLVRFAGRDLSAVEVDGQWWQRQDEGWQGLSDEHPRVTLRPEDMRTRQSSPADVVLDPAQQGLVDQPPGQALLLLGEAGFGKTTVALHRLARLRALVGPELKAAVIVPTEGLRRLSAALLERMGVGGVEVWLYDRWAREQARRAFRKLPERESQDATVGVIRIKRDPALRGVLAELAKRRPAKGRNTRRRDLLYLFGDRLLMEKLAATSIQGIGKGMVAEILEHTHVQFGNTAEEEFAHVDADRLQTLDGRTLDDGTPNEDAGTIDVEDYGVLFELDRIRAERAHEAPAQPARYDCLVLDEAQEFAPLELALMGRALAPGGSLIVAGDAGQQVDPTACFDGWDSSMRALGSTHHQTGVLEISYRCPPDVTTLARRILDGQAIPASPAPSIVWADFANACHQADWLTRELRELQTNDPRASVALICRAPESARRIAQHLRRGVGLRLALDGDYQFLGGINVTCVQQAKGLEFDYVVVPDASASIYPETPQARRALYVATTRASHQLILSSVGPWTEILRRG